MTCWFVETSKGLINLHKVCAIWKVGSVDGYFVQFDGLEDIHISQADYEKIKKAIDKLGENE